MKTLDDAFDEPTPVEEMTAKLTKARCLGCYNDVYNHGCGGAKECWSFVDAKVIKRKRVGINDIPPWTARPILLPSCYRQQGAIFVKPEVNR